MSRDKIIDKSKQLTPAEELGLKLGSKIKVIAPSNHPYSIFNNDDIIILVKDNGTKSPYFTKLNDSHQYPFSLTRRGWEHYTEEEVEYKEGDKVKIIGNTNSHSYAIGDIVTLKSRDYNFVKGCFYWYTKEGPAGRVRECDMEPYSETEVFKSGDRVKITNKSRSDFDRRYTLESREALHNGKPCWTFRYSQRSALEEEMELIVEGKLVTGLDQPVITGNIGLSSNLNVGATDKKKEHTLFDTGWAQYARMALDASEAHKGLCSGKEVPEIMAYRHQTPEGSAKSFISFTPSIFKQTKGEINMSTQRRVVNVILIDEDAGLDVSNSLVKDFGQVVTEDDNSVMVQELIMDNDMKAILTKHNDKRAQTVDKDIQNRTGKKVMLQPVKLKNLKWIVK